MSLQSLAYVPSSSSDCGSQLERLLFRAAIFEFTSRELHAEGICKEHKTYLERAPRMDNCKICKTFGGQLKASTHGLRNISKILALAVAQENSHSKERAVYDKPICGRCRLLLETKYLTEAMKNKANTTFGKCQSRSPKRVTETSISFPHKFFCKGFSI
jgi:CRISPR/Cas system CSM-associated protein Csm3 (group 7 of RAMP superfamily)